MKLRSLLALALLTLGVTAAPALRADDPVPREIALTANDAMQFSLAELTAAPGEKIALKLTHVGKLPKTAMGHNWMLFAALPEAEITKLLMDAMKNAPDYLPADRSSILARTKLLGGGESDTVVFTAPAKPGAYPFYCSFPGHFAMMKGKLVVK
ncbi:MAG: azurin [Opitutaceae bacterium]|jgi:azurin|nr:azurin [Opitutaceae bacterium]